MTTDEKLVAIAEKLAEKKTKENAIKTKYKDKEKEKKLTLTERIDRLEEMCGIS